MGFLGILLGALLWMAFAAIARMDVGKGRWWVIIGASVVGLLFGGFCYVSKELWLRRTFIFIVGVTAASLIYFAIIFYRGGPCTRRYGKVQIGVFSSAITTSYAFLVVAYFKILWGFRWKGQSNMSLQEFSRDVVPILQLFIGVSGLASLLFLWWQLRETNRWNKIACAQRFLDTTASADRQRKVYDSLKKLNIDVDRVKSVTPEELGKIQKDDDAYFAIRAYLDDFETLGAAINLETVDSDLLYRLHSVRLIGAYEIFQPFILMLRTNRNNPDIYSEMETSALAWMKKEGRRA